MPSPFPEMTEALEALGIVHLDHELGGNANNTVLSDLTIAILANENTSDEIKLLITLLCGIVKQNASMTGDIASLWQDHKQLQEELHRFQRSLTPGSSTAATALQHNYTPLLSQVDAPQPPQLREDPLLPAPLH